ncbi:uncharacterized protein LOC134301991 [Trichomycterus rosablanca]|uniref:uncharacterized protein LOC134301991 n=1 Tax=Trichomycterus rosablanca TaxID=2290929 RepID=UPI002F357EB6
MAGIIYVNMLKVYAVFLLVYCSVLHCQGFSVIESIVNKSVTLPCQCSENTSEVQWWIFLPVTAVIIKYQNGKWQTKNGFQNRFTMLGDTSGGNFSMTISTTVYNNAGSYRCTCDNKASEVKLNVYVPLVINARVGENVSLPCYGDTRRDAKDVKWKKNGQTVHQYTHQDKPETPEKAPEGRFMLSKEGFLDGDLSLYITSVDQSDAGLYLCFIHDESRNGEPSAVLLHVHEDQQSATPDYCWYGVAVLALVLGLAAVGLISCLIARFKRSQPVTSRSRCPVQEETQMIKPSSTQPILNG